MIYFNPYIMSVVDTRPRRCCIINNVNAPIPASQGNVCCEVVAIKAYNDIFFRAGLFK